MTALASCLARPAGADVITICVPQETSTGTYFYPQNEIDHSFAPGYFYAPADGAVTFKISAPDGATLHIFDDAAGTNELPVPAELQQAGQAHTFVESLTPQRATVYLTQGWHKCYVELNLLSVRAEEDVCVKRCSLSYTSGILYDKVQSVDAAYDFAPWEVSEDGTYTCTGTVTFTLPSGEAAVGDTTTYGIAKVTSDIEGNHAIATMSEETDEEQSISAIRHTSKYCPTSSLPLVTISSDGTTDSDGKIHVTLHWNGATPAGQTVYVWMQFADGSQSDLSNGGTTGVTFQAPPMMTAFYYGPTGIPVRVVQVSRSNATPPVTLRPRQWGHATQYRLRVEDRNGYGWTGGYINEKLTTTSIATACPADTKTDVPGEEAHNVRIDMLCMFTDFNGAKTFIRDTGDSTLWFTADQFFTVKAPYLVGPTTYPLNTHHLTHYQGYATRSY